MFNDDKDEVLSDILDGLIDFQERSPTVSNTASMAASNNPQAIAASRADERRISDIERFLASSEHSLLQQQVLQQHQVIINFTKKILTKIYFLPFELGKSLKMQFRERKKKFIYLISRVFWPELF